MGSETSELKDKLVRLTDELSSVTALKKSANKDYNEQIKDIKLEIGDTMDSIKTNEKQVGDD